MGGRGQFDAISCRTRGVAAVRARSRHAFPRHMHDEYGIGLIRRGAQKSRSGRGIVEAGAGDMITCNPGEVHDGLPIGDRERAWTMLYFEPWLVAEAAADIFEGRTAAYEFQQPKLRNGRIAARFQRLLAALTERERTEDHCWEQALLELLADLACVPAAPFSAAPASIGRARARIDDDFVAAVPLAELAREAGLSRFQFLRAFERVTGLTPHAYRIQRRLHRARTLIAKRTPLADAAAASGFADQSHMTRLFVRSYGLSPGRYAAAIS